MLIVKYIYEQSQYNLLSLEILGVHVDLSKC